jgi:Fe-S-cluster-containing hydrogenase component 2
VAERLPRVAPAQGSALGCEIVRHEELCVGCGKCVAACPGGASTRDETFDVGQLLDAPEGSRRGAMGAALRRLARRAPAGPIAVPPRVTTFRTIAYRADLCLGCGACARACPAEAIEAVGPAVEPVEAVAVEPIEAGGPAVQPAGGEATRRLAGAASANGAAQEAS